MQDYLLVCVLLVFIDSFYLYNIGPFFNRQIQKIQKEKLVLNPWSTVLCYMILTFGVFYAIEIKKLSLTEMFGLGIFVYGVYETTNHAIFKKWDWTTVAIDGIWGGILFTLVAIFYHKAKSLIKLKRF